ncbi:MAG: response regulator transcription factor [Xanthobacteraceae bacterium]
MIRLLIADDHEIFREGLRQILAEQRDMQICGEAADGEAVLERLRESSYDVLVLDMSMPKRSGVALIGHVHARCPDLAILVLSMHHEPQYAVQAIRAGAAGYVTKANPAADLMAGIRHVARGGIFISDDVAERLARDQQKSGYRPPHNDFTRREFEIFHMLVAGQRVSEIARALNLSEKTVSTHKTRIQRKIDAYSSAAIVRYAIKHRLIETEVNLADADIAG